MGTCMPYRHKVNPELSSSTKAKNQRDEDEKNFAVDYALKNNSKEKVAFIEIIPSCKSLPNIDTFAFPNPLAVLYVDKNSRTRASQPALHHLEDEHQVPLDGDESQFDWVEQGRTEIKKGDPNPIFIESFQFQAINHEKLIIKIKIFNVNDFHPKAPLTKHQLLGEQNFRISEILNQGNFCTKPLYNSKKSIEKQIKQKRSTITLRFEEIEQTTSVVQLAFALKDLQIRGMFQYQLFRSRDLGEFVPVFTGEIMRYDRTHGIQFEQHDFMMKELCRNDENRLLRVEVYEVRKGVQRLFAQAEFTIREVAVMKQNSFPLINRKIMAGTLVVSKCNFINRYTFLDYIHGGCEVSLMVAFDFTLSNKHQNDPKSMHYVNPDLNRYVLGAQKRRMQLNQQNVNLNQGGPMYNEEFQELENEYQQALRKTIKFLDYYDTDGFVTFLGYGAKLPPFFNTVSQCFAVNGNIFQPEERGIDALMNAYNRTINQIIFHGPSAMSPIIRYCSKIASFAECTQENQFYYLLVIFSNGNISDMESTVEAVVQASDAPLSIIIIGIGEGDHSKLEKLDADDKKLMDTNKRTQSRDIVQYVNFRKFMDNDQEFARELLSEMPRQIKEFFEKRGILPKDHKTTTSKHLQERDYEIQKNRRRALRQRIESPYLKELRVKFIQDILNLGFERSDIEMIVNKGLYADDRNLAVEQLSQLKTNPELLAEEKERAARLVEQKKREQEEQERKLKQLNKFDDERDLFKYELPLLAPSDFKPLKRHRMLCKICYEEKINSVIMPCKHSLFCIQCSQYLKKTCPICEVKIDQIVRTYDLNAFAKNMRQL